MKSGATLLVGSTLIAVIYGVLFSAAYPFVSIDAGIISLCALAGLATSFALAGVWKLLRGSKP